MPVFIKKGSTTSEILTKDTAVEFDISTLGHTPIDLPDAELPYQPVKGTSNNSKYFLMAMSSDRDIKLAVRYLNGKLSLRLVLGGVKDHSSKLKALCLVYSEGGYYSKHLDISNGTYDSRIDSACRAFGSVVGAMRTNMKFVCYDLEVIYNKGA